MYKHWKKILLAMTAFFWNACDNNSTPTAPQITPNSSSGTNVEPASSSVAETTSSAVEESRSSSTVNATSSATPPPVSSAVGETSSSSVTAKSSSATAPASSSVKEKVSSSSLDQNADLYGCPPDVCGAELSSSAGMIAPKYGVQMSSSSRGMIAPKYGVPIVSSSSQGFEDVPLYGVSSNVCVKAENDSTLSCNGGVTCTESVTENTQFPSCSGDQICAKYGVVIIKDKTYKCSDGKVYNEAEFKARYDILTVVENVKKKVPCYKNGSSMDCDDGESFEISKDDSGNVIYRSKTVDLSEKDFLKKYEVLEMAPALYGPPCMFNGTCDEEK
ncbi:hypothetical protein [Fibrobacter sp.]|uniref:hypothetical protein n=1 Tax=Fibrobacter sp. TaxID=35828 RepID=UPI0025BC951C|nr:hypothetical protein [Fibrobacter sp.]MBR3072436.1 hypothetical protein [Fibrobacter sp.]